MPRDWADPEIAKARRRLEKAQRNDAAGGLGTAWLYDVRYADALFEARRWDEAAEAYVQALRMSPGEAGTASIEGSCERRLAECLSKLKRRRGRY
jgi:tetratricopeptide (TPR) repeat protein